MSENGTRIAKRYDPVKRSFYLAGDGNIYGTHEELDQYFKDHYSMWFGAALVDETTLDHIFPMEYHRKKK
jgi:hypothetical protein